MSDSPAQKLKKQSIRLAQLIKDECGEKVGHSRCLEIVAKFHGFKNWRTALAAMEPDAKNLEKGQPQEQSLMTVGDIKALLSTYDDNVNVVIHDYDHVDPDYNSDGSVSGPAGWLTKVHSLKIRPNHNVGRELVLDLEFQSEDWSTGPVSKGLYAEVDKKRQIGQIEEPLTADEDVLTKAEMDEAADWAAENFDPNEPEPTQKEMDEAGDRWLTLQEEIRRGK